MARKSVKAKPTRAQLDLLVEVSRRVETLWQIAYRRLRIAEVESHRDIPVWGRDVIWHGSTVSREEIEASLNDSDGAYQRLKLIMDAWCAFWFWPLHGAQSDPTTRVAPPSVDQWISALRSIAGRDPQRSRAAGMKTLASATDWVSLNQAEQDDLAFALAEPIEQVLDNHPWLRVCQQVTSQQGFFHWELDFATVFGRGGFDLQLGNPPWVRPRSDVDALLAETDPWWQLELKPSEAARATRRRDTLATQPAQDLVIFGTTEVSATAGYIGSPNFPLLSGLQPDLYRCFMAQTWAHGSARGMVGLIHPETHFTDEKAGILRSTTYIRLRRHWQFLNALVLFEVHHQVSYGVHVYGASQQIGFLHASGLYHPETVLRSFDHGGSGDEPGFKGPDGKWDLRPHRSRISRVTTETLSVWHEVLEDDSVPIGHTRMLYTVNTAVSRVLAKLAKAPRLGSLGLQFSRGWDESVDRKKGRFVQDWGTADSWSDVILQGPHLHVNNPFYKSPNATMLHNQDWSITDLECLPSDAIPVTAYKPTGDRAKYDAAYTHWGNQGETPARDSYRVAWRAMAGNANERTLISALIPPMAAHVDGVFSGSVANGTPRLLVQITGQLSSLLSDFSIRAAPKSTIRAPQVSRLAATGYDHALIPELELRTLRLNCVTSAYSALWHQCWSGRYLEDHWTGAAIATPLSNRLQHAWNAAVPIRVDADRRQAQLEIDALVALMLGVTSDELCTVYRTQFAVLYGYDQRDYTYDVNGRLVPNRILSVWRKKGDSISEDERTDTNQAGYTYTYELPFRTYDREADMRQAYAEFERRLAERS